MSGARPYTGGARDRAYSGELRPLGLLTELADRLSLPIDGPGRFLRKDVSKALGPMIYVVRTRDELIKIGYSADFLKRIQWFNGELLAFTPGTHEDEQAIHQEFEIYLARGCEYYYETHEIVLWINELRRALHLDVLEVAYG